MTIFAALMWVIWLVAVALTAVTLRVHWQLREWAKEDKVYAETGVLPQLKD